MPSESVQSAKDKLKPEQIEEFRGAFDGFADDTGNISCESLKTIFKSLGQEMSDQELDEMVKEVDEDGSGEIDFDEFLGMMVSLLGLDEPDDAKDAFKCLDNNQSGTITIADLEEALKGSAEQLTAEEISSILKECDPSGSGGVNLETFKKVFMF